MCPFNSSLVSEVRGRAKLIERFNATLNTPGGAVKGAYVQLDAVLANTIYGFVLVVHSPGNAGQTYLIDIAIGPPAGEVDTYPNIHFESSEIVNVYRFESNLAPGIRISARASSSIVASSVVVDLYEEQAI